MTGTNSMVEYEGCALKLERVVESALYVNDLELAESFYRVVLNLMLLGREPGRSAFFSVGRDCVLLLFNAQATLQSDNLPAHGAVGPGHIALGVGDAEFDAWRAHLVTRGVFIEQDMNWPRGGRSFYFRDPAGNLLEIVTRGVWGLSSGW